MIHYVIGDATQPVDHIVPPRTKIIVHCCNDQGKWGAGFTRALTERWPEPERAYRAASPAPLGSVIWVAVDVKADGTGTWVANLIGQSGVVSADNPHPVKYDALYEGLTEIADNALSDANRHFTLHMPRMGAGLAGGSWPVIEALIEEACAGLDVYVYDLPL